MKNRFFYKLFLREYKSFCYRFLFHGKSIKNFRDLCFWVSIKTLLNILRQVHFPLLINWNLLKLSFV